MINNFEFYLKKYEQAINKYARDLSNEIGKSDELKDYCQVGAKALFELYKKREELINFEPEIYQYKDILIKAKKKGLIIDFNIGVRNPYKYMSDFLTLATKWVRSVLKNDMRDHRRQSLSYDQKTILSNYIDHTPNINLKPNSIRYRAFKSINLYNFNIFKITKENIINRVDILNILKEIKNPNLKKIFIYWSNFYNAYEIAELIGISNQAIYKNIDQIKKILNLYFNEVN